MRLLRVVIILIMSELLFFSNVFSKEIGVKNLLTGYILIQESLAKDDLKGTQLNSQELQKLALTNSKEYEIKKINEILSRLIKSRSLFQARDEFKKLSPYFVKWIEKNKEEDFEIIYCPMAGAKWVQKKGEILNPYFGNEMLHCGEKAS